MKNIITAKNINFSYGNTQILHDISFSIPKGKFISIVGQNGSGKTTLFNLLCGYKKTDCGEIVYMNHEVSKINPRERAKIFSVIHQNENTNFPFTCLETVILGLHPHLSRFEKISENDYKKIYKIMKLTDTYDFSQKLITQISGGEKQRVSLARAIVQNPSVLFIDEAMSDLDICAKIKMFKIIKNMSENNGLTVISINHDINTAYKFSDIMICLKNGKITSCGNPKDIINKEFFNQNFGVKAEILKNKGFFITDTI